jgi:hypothetical protein
MGSAMSLFTYFNTSSSNSTTTTSGSYMSSVYSSALEKLTAAKASLDAGATGTTTTASDSGVSISIDATIAAATKADAETEASVLTANIRAALDSQYADKKGSTADLSAMSPRAVATVLLNASGQFSPAEVLSAKAEMRARDRAAFLQATQNDFSIDSLQAYQTARLTAYGAMSAEERAVRGERG